MSLGQKIAANLPFLRRYARALTGSQASGDAYVRATLEAAIADQDLKNSLEEGRVPLYRAFNKLWASAYTEADNRQAGSTRQETVAHSKLSKVTPLNRQALLLTSLENFSVSEAATIMDIPAADVESLIGEAIAKIEAEASTTVLIIEDEPLISMQLEDLVTSLGHEVCGTAATRTQAKELASETRPGLVLADIQLADGSSGLDAADDILAMGDVPVIFITAYPERLLTGDRLEPTYLVTKPFQESTVRTVISQALFMNEGAIKA
ncbi:response regulator [Pontixanthobacter aquaemixtae]|uniref:Response regulator n=1 Tax=Pontixanthobacter aquaemixtae TaxID=1958940 RepID=A0A845A2G7_9SPHN|nr:response regulator [Pontixanthobacter aquaemixtae]MXO91819.1 response regulator [Pontixanthobacter aquaemixtae]